MVKSWLETLSVAPPRQMRVDGVESHGEESPRWDLPVPLHAIFAASLPDIHASRTSLDSKLMTVLGVAQAWVVLLCQSFVRSSPPPRAWQPVAAISSRPSCSSLPKHEALGSARRCMRFDLIRHAGLVSILALIGMACRRMLTWES